MSVTSQAQAPRPESLYALVLAAGMAATVGTALAFQHIGGYLPCKLCYEQRVPYYIGVPLMVLALAASLLDAPRWLVRLLLAAGGVLMLWGLYLGTYHAGVEWGWWAGPTDCGVAFDLPPSTSGGVLDQIDAIMPPSCDKAALRILGLSFAGWNVLASAALAAIAFRGATRKV